MTDQNPDVGSRLLVVEDDPDVAMVLRGVAEKSGYDVTIAADAANFRTALASLQPDMITLDMVMPGGDGVEMIRWLSQIGSRASVILISGVDARTLNAARRLALDHGLNLAGVLEKPVELGDLRQILGAAATADIFPTQADLVAAIENGEMILEYQPKVSLAEPWKVESVEALVRWHHPEKGIIRLDDFLPAVERHGQMAQLTDCVLETSFKQCAAWQKEHPLSVAVNLHPSLLSDLEFPDRAAELLRRHQLQGRNLIVEVTESGAMADPTATMEILTRLRLMGFRVSMDDFGTGYSSLLQLHRMPFSEIKIDKSFVLNIEHDREARLIVRAIADLGRNLELATCAEGVETRSALAHIQEANCEMAQGYLFSRSLPANEVLSFLVRGFENVRASDTRWL